MKSPCNTPFSTFIHAAVLHALVHNDMKYFLHLFALKLSSAMYHNTLILQKRQFSILIRVKSKKLQKV